MGLVINSRYDEAVLGAVGSGTVVTGMAWRGDNLLVGLDHVWSGGVV
jgi:hypothetical protein